MDKKKLKVVEIVPSLGTGGAETMVKDYCLLFDKNKIDVTLIVMDRRYSTYNEEAIEKAGIRVFYLSELLFKQHDLGFVRAAIRKISRFVLFRKIIMQEKPDIIHIHLHLGNYIELLPLNKMDCCLFMTIHNVIDNYFSKNKEDKDKYREYKKVRKLVDDNNMTLIALHDELNRQLQDFFETKNVITLNNGIILDRFNKSLYDRCEIRKQLGYSESDFVIGNVGSMTNDQKNHDFIIYIFSEISKKYGNAKLLLVGQGKKKKDIIQHITQMGLEDKITILSNRGDVPQLLLAMDVFFFPSKWEGFGNVMIEAQAMDMKCVVSTAVPKDTRVSGKVIALDLQEPKDKWISALMTDNVQYNDKVKDISDFDMENSVAKLEKIFEMRAIRN